MAYLKVVNRAVSALAADITDTATSLDVTAGGGAKFPSSGDFHITIEGEILKCTARSTDTLTVERAQEGTTAAAHTAGKSVELRITAGVITNVEDELDSHAGATTGIHGVGASTVESASGAQSKVDTHAALTAPHSATDAATASRLVLRDASARAKFAAPAAAGDALIKGTRVTVAELPALTIDKIWKGTGASPTEIDVPGGGLIGKVQVGSDTDYVEFTGLNGDDDELYHLVVRVKNGGTVGDSLMVWVNGSYFTTKHLQHYVNWDGTTASVTYGAGTMTNGFDIGWARPGNWEWSFIWLMAKTGSPRISHRRDMRENDAGNDVKTLGCDLCIWYDTTTNITSLRVVRGHYSTAGDVVTNGIGAGSTIWLYKYKG